MPFVLVLLSPCVRFLHYFPNAVVHTAWVAGSAAIFLYFVIVSPLMGVDYGGTVWCSVPVSVCFYFKHVFGLAFSHLLICVEIICEKVEGLLRDETWGLDGYWLVSSWWCLSFLWCIV